MRFRTLVAGLALVALSTIVSSVLAQQGPRPRQTLGSRLNMDVLVDNYIRVLSRKYDLSDDQSAYTQALVRQRLDEFMGRHPEMGDLVDELFEVRGGGDVTPEQLMDWGRRVLPLYQEAKAVIVQANAEWRETLTDQQKLVNDDDLRLMTESFSTTEDQLQRLVTGQMTVEEFRHPQGPAGRRRMVDRPPMTPRGPDASLSPTAAGPEGGISPAVPSPGQTAKDASGTERPGRGRRSSDAATGNSGQSRAGRSETARPAAPGAPDQPGSAESSGRSERLAGRRGTAPVAETGKDYESKWEAYVRQFIEKYQLNDDQKDRAQKVLKDCQQQADRYMRSRQAELERLDRRMAELRSAKDKDQLKELQDLTASKEKLLEPIAQIFDRQLKPRLEKLPTRAQRDAAEKVPEKGPKKSGGGG
jgi:hypothetical protein